jgi:hypothetical protein
MFKKASWSVCTSTIVVSPDPSSPSVPNSSTVKLHKALKRTLMTEPAAEGDILLEYSSD